MIPAQPTPTPLDPESLARLFRRTMHEANNELMAIVQESEIALLKEDPERMRTALSNAIEHALAISRLHRETRRELLGGDAPSSLLEKADGAIADRAHGAAPAGGSPPSGA